MGQRYDLHREGPYFSGNNGSYGVKINLKATLVTLFFFIWHQGTKAQSKPNILDVNIL